MLYPETEGKDQNKHDKLSALLSIQKEDQSQPNQPSHQFDQTNPFSQQFNQTNPMSVKVPSQYIPITAISQGTPEPAYDDDQTEYFPPTPMSIDKLNKVQLISIQHGGQELSSFRSYTPQSNVPTGERGFEDYRMTKHFQQVTGNVKNQLAQSISDSEGENQSQTNNQSVQCECDKLPELLDQL